MAKKNKALEEVYKKYGIQSQPQSKADQMRQTASNLYNAANRYNMPEQTAPARIERHPVREAFQNFASDVGGAAKPIGTVFADDSKRKTRAGNVISAGQNQYNAGLINALGFMLSTKQDENSDAAMMFGTAAGDSLSDNAVARGLNKAREKASTSLFNIAGELDETARKNEERAKKNTNAVTRFLVDAGITGTQLLNDVGTNVMLPGSGLAMMGTRTFGSSAREALDSGATQQQAFNYAASSAIVEVLSEKIFDVAQLFGGGAADDWIEKAVGKWAKTPQGMTAMRTLFAAATEGGEELASDFINPIIRLFYDSDAFKESYGTAAGRKELFTGAARDFALGGVLGGLGNIANVGSNAAKNSEIISARPAAPVTPEMYPEVAKAVTPSEGEKAAQERLNAELAQIPAAEENAAESNTEPNTAEREDAVKKAQTKTDLPENITNMLDDSKHRVSTVEFNPLFEAMLSGKTPEEELAQWRATPAEERLANEENKSRAIRIQNVSESIASEFLRFMEIGETRNAYGYEFERVKDGIVVKASDGRVLGKTLDYDDIIYQENEAARLATQDMHDAINGKAGQNAAGSEVAENATTGNEVTPESSVGAATHGYDAYSAWQNKSNKFHPEGENPARPVDLPVTNPQGKQTMRGGRTVMEAEATPDQRVREIEQAFVGGKFAYMPETNDSRVQSATDTIERVGWQKAKDDWTAAVRAGKADADLVAMGAVLFNNAANSGMNAEQFLDLANDYIQLSHNAGQALQAQRILKTLTPESRLFMMQRSVQDLNEEYKKKLGDKAPDVEIDKQLLQDYLDAETDAERDAAENAIIKSVASQLPSTWMDKWTALRYLNMLGNFKTQGRNIVGNTTMGLTAKAKREVLAAMEHVAHIVTGGKYERMTSFVVSPKLYAAARADFKNVQKAALGEAKFSDIGTASRSQLAREIQDEKRAFKNNGDWGKREDSNVLAKGARAVTDVGWAVLNAYQKATTWSMEQGDVIFSRSTYANTLAGYLKAHGVTAEMMENGTVDPDVLEKGRLYAIKEAQEATFRDTNQFSGWVSQIARKPSTPKAVRAISEGVLPFRKTPANVLVRGEEYSPLGVFNSFVKTFQAISKNSDVTANDALNQWAKTLTGSAVAAAGFLLAKAGMLHGADDKNKDQASFEDLTGLQEYSIIINGKSYTIDTFSPTVMPLLVGGTFYELWEEGGLNPKDIESAITSLADPMINMSMLSGVNDAISNVQFSDNNLIQMALTSAAGYLSQGLTNTLVGQFERTFEGENRMSTYTDEESPLPNWMQKTFGKASAKTPKWDYNQTEYINNWGETESNGSLAQRAFNNFINPTYVSEISDDPVDRELARLHDVVGGTDFYPNSIYEQPSMKRKGEEIKLTQAQKEAYQTTYGQTMKSQIRKLISSKQYKALSDAEKAAAISNLESYATVKGKQRVGADADDLKWTSKSEGSVAQNAAYRAMYQTAVNMARQKTGKDSPSDASLVQAVVRQKEDYDTTIQIMAQFLEPSMMTRYETAYSNGYDFTTSSKLVEAYNEKSYDFGTTDAGNPKGRGKEGTIAWAQEELGLTYTQAVTLWTYMCKK